MRSNERRKAEKASEIAMKNTPDDEISTALAGIRSRLDTLASINAENILNRADPRNATIRLSRNPTLPWDSSKPR